MKNKLFCITLALLLIATMTFAVSATIPEERLLPRLVDDADLLTDSEESVLLSLLDDVSTQQQCDVAVVTVDSLEGKSARDYADDFYDYNGYGMGAGDDGLLLLVAMNDREWHITTHGLAVTVFTDSIRSHMADDFVNDLSGGDDHDAAGDVSAGLEGLVGAGLLVTLDEEGARDGGGDAHGGEQQGEHGAGEAVGHGTQSDGRDDGAHIGLEEVGAHAGHVAHVIAHVVGDGGGVAGVVLGDTGFHLTHQVGAHVGGLGVDAAAHTGEQGDGGGTQREAGQHAGVLGQKEHHAAAQKAQTHHAHTHDSAAGEGDGQGLIHAGVLGGSGRADIGAGGHIHAEITGQSGEQGTGQEGHGGGPADAQTDGGKQRHHEEHQDLVLRHQKGLCAFVNVGGDLLHALGTGVLPGDLAGQECGEGQGGHTQNGRQDSKFIHSFSILSFRFPSLFRKRIKYLFQFITFCVKVQVFYIKMDKKSVKKLTK